MAGQSETNAIWFALKTIVAVVLALVGAWALDVNTKVNAQQVTVETLRTDQRGTQTKLDMLLIMHGFTQEQVDKLNQQVKARGR